MTDRIDRINSAAGIVGLLLLAVIAWVVVSAMQALTYQPPEPAIEPAVEVKPEPMPPVEPIIEPEAQPTVPEVVTPADAEPAPTPAPRSHYVPQRRRGLFQRIFRR